MVPIASSLRRLSCANALSGEVLRHLWFDLMSPHVQIPAGSLVAFPELVAQCTAPCLQVEAVCISRAEDGRGWAVSGALLREAKQVK